MCKGKENIFATRIEELVRRFRATHSLLLLVMVNAQLTKDRRFCVVNCWTVMKWMPYLALLFFGIIVTRAF